MTSARLRDERRRLGRVAAVAAPLLASMMLVTMPLVGYGEVEVLRWLAVVAPSVAVAALIGWFAPWHRWPDRALLAVPVTSWICLAVFGAGSDGRASVYAGYNALLFLFIGLSQRPWTSLFSLPPAIAVNVVMYGGLTAELAARLPISITVWVATAEVVARYRMRTGATVAHLEVRAQVDPLTGCDNRYDLAKRLAALQEGDAVCLLDIDHFKVLNDTDSHAAGDQVLIEVGSVLRQSARRQDTVIRYGGDEFLVLMPGAGARGAQSFDERLRATWATTARSDATFSTGLAVVGPAATSAVASHAAGPAAVARADGALYEAKAAGRNRMTVSRAAAAGVAR